MVLAGIAGSWIVFSPSPPGTALVSQPPKDPSLPADLVRPVDAAHPADPNQRSASKAVVAADGSISANASAAGYIAPKDRSMDMQLFDKALLYLLDVQEPDGHFDSAKTGAAPEFQNLNNDIVITAIAAWVLMGSSSGVNQNTDALAGARKARRWMESKIKPDGIIADGPGESALAQFFASDLFRLAASYSTRDSLRQTTNRLNSAALLKMKAKNGGYGLNADSAEPNAEMLGFAAFVYKFAGYDGFKFDAYADENKKPDDKNTTTKTAFPIEDEILGNIRAGFKRLDSKADKSGAIFAEKPEGPPDWRATVGGMQAMFMINPSRTTVTPALEFIFGPFDKQTESYPRILEHVSWGKNGEGYDAMMLWQGSIAVIYMFTDDKYESKTWVGNLRTILKDHQSSDGSWAVAGEDAKRGRVWRTGLHAMTMALTSPPPPPPAPPPDDQTINTPAVPPKTK